MSVIPQPLGKKKQLKIFINFAIKILTYVTVNCDVEKSGVVPRQAKEIKIRSRI